MYTRVMIAIFQFLFFCSHLSSMEHAYSVHMQTDIFRDIIPCITSHMRTLADISSFLRTCTVVYEIYQQGARKDFPSIDLYNITSETIKRLQKKLDSIPFGVAKVLRDNSHICQQFTMNDNIRAFRRYTNEKNIAMVKHLLLYESDENMTHRRNALDFFGYPPRPTITQYKNLYLKNDAGDLREAVTERNLYVLTLILMNMVGQGSNGYKNQALWIAVENNCLDAVKILIRYDANVNYRGSQWDTLLTLAAKNGYIEIALYLIQYDACVDAKVDHGFTALHVVAKKGYRKMVQLLLDSGADINAKTSNENTPLFFAAAKGHDNMVQLLIHNGVDVASSNRFKETALHAAAYNGYVEIVECLGSYGCDIYAKTIKGFTALDFARLKKHFGVVTCLMQRIEKEKKLFALLSKNDIGGMKGLLHDRELWFLKNARNKKGQFLLHCAAKKGYVSIAEYLIDNGTCIDIKTADSKQWTALHYASRRGHLDVVKFLVSCGSDVDALTSNKNRALDLAVKKGHSATISYLMRYCNQDTVVTTVKLKQVPLDLIAQDRCDFPKIDKNISTINHTSSTHMMNALAGYHRGECTLW